MHDIYWAPCSVADKTGEGVRPWLVTSYRRTFSSSPERKHANVGTDVDDVLPLPRHQPGERVLTIRDLSADSPGGYGVRCTERHTSKPWGSTSPAETTSDL